MKISFSFLLLIFSFPINVSAGDSNYASIAKKYKDHSLTQAEIKKAEMQGECLVGLKELTFKRKDKFDPVSEWTNYRSVSLLEQYSPCEVLIMLNVANQALRKQNGK